MQNKEVKTNDGYAIVEPLLEQDLNKPPHELHLIKKIKNLIGEPWWVKKAMRDLGFKSHFRNEWDIVYNIKPNTTEINNIIWTCKHVVKITAIKFKNGYPSEQDIGNTRLNLETGEFEIIKPIEYSLYNNLNCFKLNGVNVTTDLKTNSSFKIDSVELKAKLHSDRALGMLNQEYFPTVYDYKYDQDKPGVVRYKGRPDTTVKEDEVADM